MKCEDAFTEAGVMPSRLVEWLRCDRFGGLAPVVEESRCAVVQMELSSGPVLGSMFENVMRSILVWPSENHDGSGSGWVMDTPATSVLSIEFLREMRYEVQEDAAGNTFTWVVVANKRDESVLLARIVNASDGMVMKCSVQRMLRSGVPVTDIQEHTFLRAPDDRRAYSGRGTPGVPVFGANMVGHWRLLDEFGTDSSTAVVFTRRPDLSSVRVMQDYAIQRELSLGENGDPLEPLGDVQPGKISKYRYDCHLCGRSFNQSGHRNEHVRKMHYGIGHPCTLCNRSFGVPSKLDRHRRAVHHDQRNHKCPMCDKCFKERSHLAQHIRRHAKHSGRLKPRVA